MAKMTLKGHRVGYKLKITHTGDSVLVCLHFLKEKIPFQGTFFPKKSTLEEIECWAEKGIETHFVYSLKNKGITRTAAYSMVHEIFSARERHNILNSVYGKSLKPSEMVYGFNMTISCCVDKK